MRKGEFIDCNNVSYSLIEPIGNGGSGEVWKVTTNNGYYAIKFLHSDESKKIIRFDNELKFCKENPHKNICSVIAEGEHNGKLFYVMPLYEKTLREIINDEKDANLLIKYILQLCVAVKFAHMKGVVHRDIKPENILIAGKKLVLADFGIAHFKDSTLTKPNDLLVSRNYLAPEQKLKNNANNIEKSADIYALGLVINECFTKQNPAGSSFKVIADDYPLYYKLDSLVENMTKQNPNERFTIEDAIVELKYIYGSIKQDLRDIRGKLIDNGGYPDDIRPSLLSKIMKRASEDLLFAKYIFENKSIEQLRKFNANWHKKISYNVDSFIFNLCMQEKIYLECKKKFDYECNGQTLEQSYYPLELLTNTEHIQIYQQIKDLISIYPLQNDYFKIFDLSGKILKNFASCSEHHCKEIISMLQADNFTYYDRNNLFDAPIIWLTIAFKQSVKENIHLLIDGYENIFGGQYKFNLVEHISINWDRTIDFVSNEDDDQMMDDQYLNEEEQINGILLDFQRQWNVTFTKIDEYDYSIKFNSYNKFAKFRNYVIKVSNSPVAIGAIKGDMLDLIKQYNFANGIVEIELSKVFDIIRPLPIVLGLRTDYQ